MSTEQFYRFLYLVVWPFFNLFHPVRTVGREHIPEGAAVICPNHTALSDPFFVAFAFQKKNPLRVMAKIQLMRVPVIGWLLGKAGIFGVDRGHADMHAAKTALRCLKEGHKLLIFPEGTRVEEGERGRQGGSGHVCHPDGGAHRPHVHPGAEALVPPYHCGDRRALLSPDPGAAGHGGGKSGDRP